MTTLATLKTDIAADLGRSDLTALIADEITRSIEFYQGQRFDFNETRDETFNTVAGQAWYTASDAASIPMFYGFDGVFTTVGGRRRALGSIEIARFEILTDNSAANGEPFSYTYYNEALGLYPVPDQAYEVRMLGHIKLDPPASDDEANNEWMTTARQMIRYRTASQINAGRIRNAQRAAELASLASEEARKHRRDSGKRTGAGRIKSTAF